MTLMDNRLKILNELIINLQEEIRFQKQTGESISLEATKQWFVLPFFSFLNYNTSSRDTVPSYEVITDNIVDYLIHVDIEPVIAVKCRPLNCKLSESDVYDMKNILTRTNIKVGILTDGDTYCFFANRPNGDDISMSPYLKIKLSDITEPDIETLKCYTRENIKRLNLTKYLDSIKVEQACKEIADNLKRNITPHCILEALTKQYGLDNSKSKEISDCLCKEIREAFSESLSDKDNITEFKTHHDYVYNDTSYGEPTGHHIEYATIFGEIYKDITWNGLLLNVVEKLLDNKYITRGGILASNKFNSAFIITDNRNRLDNSIKMGYLNEYDLFVKLQYDSKQVIKFIEKLLKFAHKPDESVLVSFKD